MKREPDNNRVKRAMEHIKAAIVSINSIKWEHRSDKEEDTLQEVKSCLKEVNQVLNQLTQ